jgi:hypothetical protein
MFNCKVVNMPLSTSEKLLAHVGELQGPNNATSYRSLVGGLKYLKLTRPDLTFFCQQRMLVPARSNNAASSSCQTYIKVRKGNN